jgi:uncharacterized protein (TIRG00374 family)
LLVLCVVLLPFISAHFESGLAFEVASAFAITGVLCLVALRRWPHRFVSLISHIARLGGARLHRFVLPKAERFVGDLAKISSGGNTGVAFAISLCIWTVSMLTVTIWLWAFDVNLPWYASFLVLLFLAFGMALPSTPGQVGTYHYFVAAGLTASGLDKVHALSVSLVGHAISIIPFTLIGLPSLLSFVVERSTQPGLGGSTLSEKDV